MLFGEISRRYLITDRKAGAEVPGEPRARAPLGSSWTSFRALWLIAAAAVYFGVYFWNAAVYWLRIPARMGTFGP